MDLMFAHARGALVHPVGIPEVGFINLHPVVHRPLTVHAVTGLRGHAIELIPLLPQRIRVPYDLMPGQFNVSNCLVIMVLSRDRDPIVVRPNIGVRREDGVRQVRCRLRTFAVRNEVLTVLDGFRFDTVILVSSAASPHWFRLVGLFPKWMPRVGPDHHHPALFRLQHDVGGIAVEGAGRIEHTLHIHIDTVRVDHGEVILHALVACHVRKLGGNTRKGIQVVTGVVQRADAPFPDLDPRVGNRDGHFRVSELHPGITGKGNVVVVDVGRHFDVLRDETFDIRIDVAHHVVMVLGVVQHVDVCHPAELARGRHVRLAGKDLAPILRRIDDQGRVTMVPIAYFFAVIVRLGLDLLPMGIRIQRNVEGIFARVYGQAGTRPGGCRPTSSLVVTGPGMLTGPELADVARNNQDHRGATGVDGLMEIVTGPFTIVNRGRFDRTGITSPSYNQVLRGPAYLMDRIQVVVLEVHHVHLPNRHRIDLASIEKLDSITSSKCGVDTAVRIVPSYLFTMQWYRLFLIEIPHHHAAEPLNLFRLQ